VTISYLYVLSCHAILVEPFSPKKPTRIPTTSMTGPDLLRFEFHAGPADVCMAALHANSVAYDLHIEDSMVDGIRYNRYSLKGKHLNFFVRNDDINPALSELMKLLHKPEDLVKLIQAHHKRTVPLPWDDQEQFGKIHRTLELIKPI
jgi:hypothetical protein